MKAFKFLFLLVVSSCVPNNPIGLPAADPLKREAVAACPTAPAIPAGLPRVRTGNQIGDYATRVELAREAEAARANCLANEIGRR